MMIYHRNFVHIDQFDNVKVSRSSTVFFARVEQFDNEKDEKNKERNLGGWSQINNDLTRSTAVRTRTVIDVVN